MRRTRTVILNQLALAAPWISLTLMVALPVWLPNRTQVSALAQIHKDDTARKIKKLPDQAGRWEGKDELPPPEAQKLLRPNAILSRTYRYEHDLKPWVHLLLVHSGDARDMWGHFPPVCYPSAGWLSAIVAEPDEVELNVGLQDGETISLMARVYHFRSLREEGGEEGIRVFDTFILPDGRVTSDLDDMNHRADRVAVAFRGVAQLQLITSLDVNLSDSVSAVQDFLSRMPELFDVLEVHKGNPA